MSCKTGEGKAEFLEKLGLITSELLGKILRTIKYPSIEHSKRIKWLYREAKIEKELDFIYDNENITINLNLDEIVY